MTYHCKVFYCSFIKPLVFVVVHCHAGTLRELRCAMAALRRKPTTTTSWLTVTSSHCTLWTACWTAPWPSLSLKNLARVAQGAFIEDSDFTILYPEMKENETFRFLDFVVAFLEWCKNKKKYQLICQGWQNTKGWVQKKSRQIIHFLWISVLPPPPYPRRPGFIIFTLRNFFLSTFADPPPLGPYPLLSILIIFFKISIYKFFQFFSWLLLDIG